MRHFVGAVVRGKDLLIWTAQHQPQGNELGVSLVPCNYPQGQDQCVQDPQDIA